MRGLLLTTSLLAILVVALASSPATARTVPAARAKAHFKAGKAAYAAGNFSEAAKEFSAGYMLDPKPGFLLNIAQSYRKAAEPKEALHYYQEYLKAAPDSKLRLQVEGLIKELEEETRPKPPPEPVPVVAVTPPPPPPPPPRSDPFYKKWWFWTGVVVVVGAGIGVGVYAGNREPDYVKEGGLGSVSW